MALIVRRGKTERTRSNSSVPSVSCSSGTARQAARLVALVAVVVFGIVPMCEGRAWVDLSEIVRTLSAG